MNPNMKFGLMNQNRNAHNVILPLKQWLDVTNVPFQIDAMSAMKVSTG